MRPSRDSLGTTSMTAEASPVSNAGGARASLLLPQAISLPSVGASIGIASDETQSSRWRRRPQLLHADSSRSAAGSGALLDPSSVGAMPAGAAREEGFHELLERLSGAHDRELSSTVGRLESEKAELERQNRRLRSQMVEQRAMLSHAAQLPSPHAKRRTLTPRGSLRASTKECAGDAGRLPSPHAKKKKSLNTTTPTNERTGGISSPSIKERMNTLRKDEEIDEGEQGALPGQPCGLADSGLRLAARPNRLSISDTGGVPCLDQDSTADSKISVQAFSEIDASEDEGELFPPRSEYTKELESGVSVRSRTHLFADPLADFHDGEGRSSWQLAQLPGGPHNSCSARYIASPRSRSRTAWQIAGAVLIVWDLFVVPLVVFCYPVNDFTIAMEWITLVYWTLNVPQTLTVGYEAGLRTVMSPSAILKAYLKSWFLIDMVVLVPDWLIVVLSFGSGKERTTSCDTAVEGVGAVRLLRNLRIMRLLRLTRIARLQKMWDLVLERIYSFTVNIVANVFSMLLLLLVLSHFISCIWYAISYYLKGENRWLVRYEMDGLAWSYLYATCLHWSLTQFTPAPMDIQPQNLTERVFTIFVVVCALVGFSYVVGRITGSLAQYRALKEEESKLFWDLRVYMKQNNVDHFLAVRIQRYLQNKWRRQARNKTYQQIKILAMLSEQLENELLFELHAGHLTIHPLVKELLKVSRVTALRLARAAVSTKQLANKDPLFIYGEKPSHMYVVIQGQFRYNRISSTGEVWSELVDQGEDWIAEPVLWSTE
jgi:hypothetical protein